MSEGDDPPKHDEKSLIAYGLWPRPIGISKKTNNRFRIINLREIIKNRPVPELQEQRLLRAASTNNTERTKELLEAGVSANTADTKSRSALHMATSRNYADIVRLLLQHGADPNVRDVLDNTPLHLAACLKNMEIISLLLDAGADPESLDVYGRNPLQLAQGKLHLLMECWKEGSLHMVELEKQLRYILIYMKHVAKKRLEGTGEEEDVDDVDDLDLMKLSINENGPAEVDDHMTKILEKLQNFTMK